jgi:Xaa-Pro aminopeptidase
VFEAQEAGMAAVKPGAHYRDFHEAAQRSLAERLVEWGFIEGPAERAYELSLQRRFTMAGTGHMLGLDVHDCAQARNDGVRIEDDLLVTADGYENLSAGLPRSADEVEAWMREFAG